MKRAILVAMAFFMCATLAFSGEFYGSVRSNKYHYPGCRWAGKIKPSNLVIFSSPEQAIRAGYRPCKVCTPPLRSGVRNKDKFFSRFVGEEESRR